MKRQLLAAAALFLMSILGARAASVLQPGGTLGIPAGAPLPEGVFFGNYHFDVVDTFGRQGPAGGRY